jgi:hypothetical protein
MNSAPDFAQEAEFSLTESLFKFPKTKEGVVLEHTFVFTNTGSVPLIITDYSVECKCTKVILPKEPISPGKKGEIKISFDTEGKFYQQDRIILLSTNTKKKVHKLRFKVFVIPKED